MRDREGVLFNSTSDLSRTYWWRAARDQYGRV